MRYVEVGRNLKNAIITIEDKRFYRHFGFDPIGFFRAMLKNITSLRFVQGGSTLTQQLVKNFYLTSERKISRKVKEAVMAFVLEMIYGKDAIFEAYMNEVYFAQEGSVSICGVGQAGRFYFGKDVRTLNLPESALLAGLIRSPAFPRLVPASISVPRARTFKPRATGSGTRISSGRAAQNSTPTTASAPWGRTAPLVTFTHPPGRIRTSPPSPANRLPDTRSRAGPALEASRVSSDLTAYPSFKDTSAPGLSDLARTSQASTLPAARSRGTSSGARGARQRRTRARAASSPMAPPAPSPGSDPGGITTPFLAPMLPE